MTNERIAHVTEGPLTHVVLWIGAPLLGGGLGWLVPVVARRIAETSWFPFQGLSTVLAWLADSVGTWLLIGLGIAAGIVFARYSYTQMLSVSVGPREIAAHVGPDAVRLARDRVAAVFLDGNRFVVADEAGYPLARETSGLDPRQLRAACEEFGYPWREEDPYAGAYTRWVPGTDVLPTGADALLRARQEALAKDGHRDAREYTAELARLGVAVREERTRQYWRLVESR